MSGLRNAPCRDVVAVRRVGAYRGVVWVHVLNCGHQVVRKRKAPSTRMRCLDCLKGKV